MAKVAAEIASCGQPDALRRSLVLAIAPALCLDASRATQVHTCYSHLSAAHALSWVSSSSNSAHCFAGAGFETARNPLA